MKTVLLSLVLVPCLGLSAIAQMPPQMSQAEREAKAKARSEEMIEAAKKPAAEDFKPSTINQPGRQYPQVNSERRVRARVVAPDAHSVALDIDAVKFPLTKGEDGAWIGA